MFIDVTSTTENVALLKDIGTTPLRSGLDAISRLGENSFISLRMRAFAGPNVHFTMARLSFGNSLKRGGSTSALFSAKISAINNDRKIFAQRSLSRALAEFHSSSDVLGLASAANP
ncbi:unnamed protein product [Strongylus vulgaris]|uniref:Uncharacterized protein n=1 Tax=Strongylus vulgaris TaxID=40348 RepID=A0A3P7IS88_STRVU|nr:unnamed protein product [Strongylus vulgaris]